MQTNFIPVQFSLPRIISDMILQHQVIGSYGNKYDVNVAEFTCNCPDWMTSRASFPFPDIRRACKHLAVYLSMLPYSFALPLPACGFECIVLELDGYTYSLVRKEVNSWIDVKVRNRKGDIYDYGYKVDDRHWSYNSRPKHAKELRAIILSWVQ